SRGAVASEQYENVGEQRDEAEDAIAVHDQANPGERAQRPAGQDQAPPNDVNDREDHRIGPATTPAARTDPEDPCAGARQQSTHDDHSDTVNDHQNPDHLDLSNHRGLPRTRVQAASHFASATSPPSSSSRLFAEDMRTNPSAPKADPGTT